MSAKNRDGAFWVRHGLQRTQKRLGYELHSAVEPQPKAKPQMNTDKHGSVFICVYLWFQKIVLKQHEFSA